jgi:hypothetical protein
MPELEEYRPPNALGVEKVTLTRFDAAGQVLMRPDNCWDIAVFRRDGRLFVLRTGMTTRPDLVTHEPGDEILTISFSAATYMPTMPGESMRNEAVFLEMFGRESVRIGGAYREIPTFDNALVFAGRLIREGIVESNRVVASILDRRPRAMSARTQQRHFLKTTGLTYKRFTLIERAQEAVALLRAGRSASDTAFALGFSDQAHLINSLREIMGETPGQIVRATTG